MQYCDYCQVHLRGRREKCVLCGNSIPMDPDKNIQEEIFPYIPPSYESHLGIRIMAFISLAVIVISFAAYLIFPTDTYWPLFVVYGLASTWLSLLGVVRKRHHIPKTILWQVIIVTLLSLFWDLQTGWRGWSIDYVIPITYVAAMLVMYVTAKIMKLSVRDYITYVLLDGIFAIIPIVFIIFRWVNVTWPSIVCAAAGIIFLSAIFIFQGENIKIELNKRMHI